MRRYRVAIHCTVPAWFLPCFLACATGIDGIVVDGSGDPVPYAHVELFVGGNASGLTEADADVNGRFSLAAPPGGSYTVEITKPNYITSTLQISSKNPRPANVLATLAHYGAVTGHVLDGAGQAIPDALVFAERAGQASKPLMSLPLGHSARADAQTGVYRLYHLEPGTYQIGVLYGSAGAYARGVVFYPGNERPEPQVVCEGRELQGIDFSVRIPDSFRITGRVESPGGAPFAVSLVSTTQPELAVGRVRTDAEGMFSFANIPPGRYTLLASGPVVAMGPAGGIIPGAPLFGRSDVEVAGSDAEVSLAVEAAHSAAFALVAQGSLNSSLCSRSMKLRLSPSEDWGSVPNVEASIGFSSEHLVSGLAPGRYRVSVDDPTMFCLQGRDLEIDLSSLAARDKPGTYTIPIGSAGSIRGVISAPADSGAVAAELAMPGRGDLVWPSQPGCPGADCNFSFTALLPGHYVLNLRVSAVDGGEAPVIRELSMPIQVAPGEQVEVRLDAEKLVHPHS